MRRRLLLVAIATLLAVVGADLFVGSRIRDGRFQGIRVPPYGIPDAATRAGLERRARETREGPPRNPYPLRSWSRTYGWVNQPGEAVEGGLRVRIDASGARGARELDATPAPDRVRVLAFGESFTFGSEVADGEDWPAQLAALDERIEVANFGVGAWGTDQALLRFRELAPRLEPDVVVLGLLLENICRNVNRYRQLYQPDAALALAKPRFRLEDGRLVLVPIPYETEADFWQAAADGSLRAELRQGDWWDGDDPLIPFSNLARAWAARSAHARRAPDLLWSRPDEEPFLVTLALLEAFHREAIALGAKVAPIVVFESRSDHSRAEELGGRLYWRTLLDALDERGIPWIDTFGPISELAAAGRPAYLDTHYSPEGNAAVARQLLDWLRERLPELQ